MKILIIGPQGSGKTTQAKILADKFNLCHISSGDLARQIASQETEIGRQFKQSLDRGEMVDDSVLAHLIKAKIDSRECIHGFVMDGYPRRMSQVQAFDPKPDYVFYIDVSDKTSWHRLKGRGREDDTPELLAIRLKLYHERTKPVIDYYQNFGKLVMVNGENTIDQITTQILSQLNSS